MYWYIVPSVLALCLGVLIGKRWERKKIFKKVIPEDWWRFNVPGKPCAIPFHGHLFIFTNGWKIAKVEFTKHIA